MRHPVREDITWVLDEHEVPARDGWSCSVIANGGYEQASISVPKTELGRADQGAPLTAYRSSGGILWFGRVVKRPKRIGGLAQITAQGPKVALEKTIVAFLLQARGYNLWTPRDGEPFNLQQNASAYQLDAEHGRLSIHVDKGADVNQDTVGGWASWLQDQITNIAFTLDQDGSPTGYQVRVSTYQGPNTQLDVAFHDYNLPSSGSSTDYSTEVTDPDCDMLAIMLRRTGADTTNSQQLTTNIRNLRVNGRAIGDIMNPGDGFLALASYMGWNSHINSGTLNVLPVYWAPSSNEGLNGLADLLAQFEDARWLALEPDPRSANYASIHYGPWGDNNRRWYTSEELGTVCELDDTEIFNQVVQPYTTLANVPATVTLKADPDPLAYTARYNNGKPIVNSFPAEPLADPQFDNWLASNVAGVLLKQVTKDLARGTLTVYDANGVEGQVSRYDLRAGDIITVTDRIPTLDSLRIVRSEYDKTKTVATVGQDVSAAALIANSTAKFLREKGRRWP